MYRAFLSDQSCGEKSVWITCVHTNTVVWCWYWYYPCVLTNILPWTRSTGSRGIPSLLQFRSSPQTLRACIAMLCPFCLACRAVRDTIKCKDCYDIPNEYTLDSVCTTVEESYHDAPKDAGICPVGTANEFHCRVWLYRCCQETRNTIALSNFEECFVDVAESTATKSAAISGWTWQSLRQNLSLQPRTEYIRVPTT